jgi:uncharacterized damage-inducible protein DinB
MDSLEIFRRHGSYNAWMNVQLMEASAQLPDEKRKQDLGAFFGSIHATLVHILVCDKMRMHQFDPDNACWPGENRTEAFDNWEAFCAERRRCDDALCRYLDALRPEDLDRPVETRSWVDEHLHVYPLWALLTHNLNHQVHHRGQVTTLLWQCGVDFGVTGFAWQPDWLESSRLAS